jgi:hypothetical protein
MLKLTQLTLPCQFFACKRVLCQIKIKQKNPKRLRFKENVLTFDSYDMTLFITE